MAALVSNILTKHTGNFGRDGSNFLGNYHFPGLPKFGDDAGTLGNWDRPKRKNPVGSNLVTHPAGRVCGWTILSKPHKLFWKKIVQFRPRKSDNNCRAVTRFRGNCSIEECFDHSSHVFRSSYVLWSASGFFCQKFETQIWIVSLSASCRPITNRTLGRYRRTVVINKHHDNKRTIYNRIISHIKY